TGGIVAAQTPHRRLAVTAVEVADQRTEEAHAEDASKRCPELPHFFGSGVATFARRASSAKEPTTTSGSRASPAPAGAYSTVGIPTARPPRMSEATLSPTIAA